MKAFWEKYKILMTCLIILLLAISGIVCVTMIGGYDGWGLAFYMWAAPTALGLLFVLTAAIALIFSRTDRDAWKKAMLVGLWLLLVSGGSCGIFLGLAFNISS